MWEPWTESSQRTRLAQDSLTWKPETVGIADVQRRLEERLTRLNEGAGERVETPGRLQFWIEGVPYSAALSALRGALPSLPEITPLPLSPVWLVGLFPLRTDLVTLIDLSLALHENPAGDNEDEAQGRMARHALLIGETGRLMAFLVDRIGDIFADNGPATHANGVEAEGVRSAARYIEAVHQAPSGDAMIADLDVARMYDDMMAKLEAWARDA